MVDPEVEHMFFFRIDLRFEKMAVSLSSRSHLRLRGSFSGLMSIHLHLSTVTAWRNIPFACKLCLPGNSLRPF